MRDGAALTEPHFSWVPSIGVSNIIIADPQEFPRWEGYLLVASLIGQSLYRLHRVGDRFIYSEPIPIGERIRDLTVLADGRILLWTDGGDLVVVSSGEVEQP